MNHEAGFFAEPSSWVLIAFVLFFVLFGRKLWAPWRVSWTPGSDGEGGTGGSRPAAPGSGGNATGCREAAGRCAGEAKVLIDGARTEAGRVAAAAAAEAEASAKRREQMALDRIAAAEKAAVDEVRLPRPRWRRPPRARLLLRA